MITGKQLFTGDSIAETLAAVIKEEPALDNLPPSTPASIRNLLRRCLDRNVRRRLVHIGEARIAIEDVLAGTTVAEPVATARGKSRERLAWSAAAVLLVALLAAGTFAYFRPSPEAAKAVRFFISPPESWNLPPVTSVGGLASAPLAVSPDGQRVAFIQKAEGKSLLAPFNDTLAAEPPYGTEGALSPFWSPDSPSGIPGWRELKKIAIAGGPPIVPCETRALRARGVETE
jgi:serine/threonine-protein kinase